MVVRSGRLKVLLRGVWTHLEARGVGKLDREK
jgi:hypothetical protein